jgi:hypothetical protein
MPLSQTQVMRELIRNSFRLILGAPRVVGPSRLISCFAGVTESIEVREK